MKPVTQSRIGAPSGNCTEASIASILEIPLSSVPDLYAIDPERKPGFHDLDGWLTGLGLVLIWAEVRPLLANPPDIRGIIQSLEIDWLAGLPWDGPHLMAGPNAASGVEHMTVAADGVMVWDPHPEHPGLSRISGFGIIVNIDRIPEQYRNGKCVYVYDVIHGVPWGEAS